MAQYFVVSLFGVVAVILGLLQTSYFGQYTRHAAMGALGLGCLAIASMFIFIEKEDWHAAFETHANKKKGGGGSMGQRKSRKKGGGGAAPGNVSKRDSNGGQMPGATLSSAGQGGGQKDEGASESAAIRKRLAKAGYNTSGFDMPQPGVSGSAEMPGAGMGTGMGQVMIASADDMPTNASSAHQGRLPMNSKEMAEASGETADPEDDSLQLISDCELCPRMVIIPVGIYVMGSPEEEPGHEYSEGPQRHVAISKPFAIGMFEVSRAEYQQFLTLSKYERKGRCEKDGLHLVGHSSHKGRDMDEYALPALCLSWWDANKYVDWLTEKTGMKYRLPSAAEWEYAARGMTKTAYHTGAEIDGTQAQFYRSQRAEPAPTEVYAFQPNPFGLYNMHGNAAEWVADCWHEHLDDAPTHQEPWTWNATCEDRITKGGSWFDGTYDIRAAARGRQKASLGNKRIGLRVVRELY